MRVPLDLRAPLPPDDEDRKFVELDRDRGFPAQIVKQVEQPLTQNRAAQHRIIRPGNADAGDLHDLLAKRLLALLELVHGELREAPLLARRGLRERHGRAPPTASGDIQTADFMVCSRSLDRKSTRL